MATNTLTAVNPLFDAEAADMFSLPAELLALRDAYVRACGFTAPSPEPSAATETRMLDATIKAAKAGTEPPDAGAEIGEAVEAGRQAEMTARLHAMAREALAVEVRTAVEDMAETIITAHLRPALASVLKDARADVEQVAHLGATPDPRRLLAEPERVRKAYLRLGEHVARYSAVRGARGVLARVGVKAQLDELGLFAEIRNAAELYPVRQDARTERRPWPAEPQPRLTWLLSNGAELWMPTPAEQDQAWHVVFGEDLARAQQGRAWGEQYRAAFS